MGNSCQQTIPKVKELGSNQSKQDQFGKQTSSIHHNVQNNINITVHNTNIQFHLFSSASDIDFDSANEKPLIYNLDQNVMVLKKTNFYFSKEEFKEKEEVELLQTQDPCNKNIRAKSEDIHKEQIKIEESKEKKLKSCLKKKQVHLPKQLTRRQSLLNNVIQSKSMDAKLKVRFNPKVKISEFYVKQLNRKHKAHKTVLGRK